MTTKRLSARSKVGGRRDGAGRKPGPGGPRSERLQILVTRRTAERIDEARGEQSRSDWGAAALERALDEPAGDSTVLDTEVISE